VFLTLALACDFRVMHRAATLRQANTAAGLSMDGGTRAGVVRSIQAAH
jgi:enoyl-CoA hydratase/carnithine racemase